MYNSPFSLELSKPILADFLKTIKPTHHYCLFYDSSESKHKVVYSYLADGINNSKGLIYICYDETKEEIQKGLESVGIDVEPNLRSRNIKLVNSEDFYMHNNRVEVLEILNKLKIMHEEFEARGLNARIVGEVNGFFDSGYVRELLRYEYSLHRFLDMPMDAICAYNINTIVRTGYSDIIMPIVRAHGKAIFSAQGGIMVLEPDNIEDSDIEELLNIRI